MFDTCSRMFQFVFQWLHGVGKRIRSPGVCLPMLHVCNCRSESKGPFVDSVLLDDPDVVPWRAQVKGNMEKSLEPLDHYIKTYEDMLDLVTLDKVLSVAQHGAMPFCPAFPLSLCLTLCPPIPIFSRSCSRAVPRHFRRMWPNKASTKGTKN